MVNTEKSGGTRYSEGKPQLVWAPLLFVGHTFDGPIADCMMIAHDAILNADTEGIANMGLEVCRVIINEMGVDRALEKLAHVSTGGADKYAPLDWYEGQSATTLVNSMYRHLKACLPHKQQWGRLTDPKSGLEHWAHALWNAACLHELLTLKPDLDDISEWQGVVADDIKNETPDVVFSGSDAVGFDETRTHVYTTVISPSPPTMGQTYGSVPPKDRVCQAVQPKEENCSYPGCQCLRPV